MSDGNKIITGKIQHRWKKGESGNPSGRPINTLQHFLRDKKNLPQEIWDAVYPLLKSDNEKIRLEAAEFLRDTRDGKPSQPLSNDPENPFLFSGEDEGFIKKIVNERMKELSAKS